MAGSILKGIGVIKSVSPKVKNPKISKIKGNIAKNVGRIKKYQDEREIIAEENLKKSKEGKENIYGTIEENKKKLEEIRGEKEKFPSRMMRGHDEGLEFEVTSEYKKGGMVKKGFPKIAKKGWK
jgi:hypothetical protein